MIWHESDMVLIYFLRNDLNHQLSFLICILQGLLQGLVIIQSALTIPWGFEGLEGGMR